VIESLFRKRLATLAGLIIVAVGLHTGKQNNVAAIAGGSLVDQLDLANARVDQLDLANGPTFPARMRFDLIVDAVAFAQIARAGRACPPTHPRDEQKIGRDPNRQSGQQH
jgi:hypothetical protein